MAPWKNSKMPQATSRRDSWMLTDDMVKDSLSLINVRRLHIGESVTCKSEEELICSYNWVENPEPTVYVPGGAAEYAAQELPIKLSPDPPRPNLASTRLPEYPFEVVFRAAEEMNPDFRFDGIDVLAGCNSMKKLCSTAGSSHASFKLRLHLVHKTLVIERCEETDEDLLFGSAGSYYGHNFEQAFTKPVAGLEKSTTHHRVLRYQMGGLNCAVRSEVDACYVDQANEGGVGEASKTNDPSNDHVTLDDTLGEPSLPEKLPEKAPIQRGSVSVISAGSGTLQSTTAELKSHANPNKKRKWWMPQIFFARSQYLITAHHEDGVFKRPVLVSDTSAELHNWTTDGYSQGVLKRTVSLIQELRNVVMRANGCACVAIAQTGDPNIQIYKLSSGKKALPDDVVEKFWTASTNND